MTAPPETGGIARRLGLCCLIAAGLGAIGVVAAVLLIGLALSAPTRGSPGPLPPRAEPVVFAAADAATLRGWFLPGQPGDGAVLLMHGIRANRASMARRATLLNDLGFSVLLFDFRGHGESDPRRVTFGAREALDAAAALDHLRARRPDERIGVIGASLGGAAALLGPGPVRVEALVLEAVYPDITRALRARLTIVLGRLSPIATPVLSPVFLRLMPLVTGVRAAELRPIARIGALRGPVLIASGTADDRTTIDDARALFDAAVAPKTFWAVPGARHEDLQAFDPEAYRANVVAFLLAALRAPR